MSTILLVDDHHALRTVFGEILRWKGHTVLEAGTAADVEHLAAQHAGSIDCSVIEAVLSTGNGVEIEKRIRSRHPHSKVLFISERHADELKLHGLLPPGGRFLRKPFAADEFTQAVEDALQAREESPSAPPARNRSAASGQ
ncbi:MAG TPA: response regulator [Bryobacteraceae bacterium]|nr:response regulator [Bryobacteraceae bacterium]